MHMMKAQNKAVYYDDIWYACCVCGCVRVWGWGWVGVGVDGGQQRPCPGTGAHVVAI